jgi:hypothetical protein
LKRNVVIKAMNHLNIHQLLIENPVKHQAVNAYEGLEEWLHNPQSWHYMKAADALPPHPPGKESPIPTG